MTELGGSRRASISLLGDLDASTIAAAEAALSDLLADRPDIVEVDLELVSFFGAAGARLIAGVLVAGIAVELRHTPRIVLRVLEIVGLLDHQLLTVRD